MTGAAGCAAGMHGGADALNIGGALMVFPVPVSPFPVLML